MNDCELRFTKQVLIYFLVRKYKDEVLYDVIHIHVTHLLLRCPWQFDKNSKNNGFKSRNSLEKDGNTFTLVPLSPKQVYKDQLKREKNDEVGSSE